MAASTHSDLPIAYHEAGHAVMGMILGQTPDWLDLTDELENRFAGVCFNPRNLDNPMDSGQRNQAKQAMMILFAGMLVEQKFHGNPSRPLAKGAAEDTARAWEHAFWLKIDDTDPREEMAVTMFHAANMLCEPSASRAVRAIATELASVKHLTGERAREIFDSIWSRPSQTDERQKLIPPTYSALKRLATDLAEGHEDPFRNVIFTSRS